MKTLRLLLLAILAGGIAIGNAQAQALTNLTSLRVAYNTRKATVNVSGSRAMVAKLKQLGAEFKYIEVPGGNHSSVVVPNLPAILDFFDAHKKTATRVAQ